MDISKLNKLSKLVTMTTKRKPKIMLDPKRLNRIITGINPQSIDINVNVDADDWRITDELKTFIKNLSQNPNLSIEEKILEIYKKLCMDYTYDDNVLSYIKKYDEDQFGLPNFYGRDTDEKWKENRAKHNRRNCFEISRILTKAIITMLEELGVDDSYEICILWDEALTHYFTGLISDEYCITLDMDDFDEIKDLTRMKTDLTIKGIKILEDPNKTFQTALDNFNSGRHESSIEYIKSMNSVTNDGKRDDGLRKADSINTDDIQFLRYALEVLTENYNLDSAGIFEYMKEIIDSKIGPSSRRKVWTEVETAPGEGKRHTRCLTVEIGNQLYIIDVTGNGVDQIFHPISKEEISENPNSGKYTKYQSKSWDDKYDGR